MKTTINVVPGKQGFQRTTPKPAPTPTPSAATPYSAIRPVQMAMTPRDIYERYNAEKPLYMMWGHPAVEVCKKCAEERQATGENLVLYDLDEYEMQEAYLTGWPCSDCGEWAVEPEGCIYTDVDGCCVANGLSSLDIVEVHSDGAISWRLGCVNRDHQAKRLVEEESYPADAAMTLIGMTWLAYKEAQARRG